MDFVSDALSSGRRLRCLAVVDDFTRECVSAFVDTSITGRQVARELDRAIAERGAPRAITVDNGPEFSGKALDEWAYRSGIRLRFIRPGKPIENAYAESFNGRLRDECLNEHWFHTLAHARHLISAWREEYNTQRPHSSLGNVTPAEYAARWRLAQVHQIASNLTADSGPIPY